MYVQDCDKQAECSDNTDITESIFSEFEIFSHSPLTVDVDALSSSASSRSSTDTNTTASVLSSADYDQDGENYCLPSAPAYSDITASTSTDAMDHIVASDEDTVPASEVEKQDQEVQDQIDHSMVMFGYKVVGDNIDKNVRPRYVMHSVQCSVQQILILSIAVTYYHWYYYYRYIRQGSQTLSFHCYHAYAVRDRIDISNFSDNTPDLRNTPVLSLQVNEVLPSATDEQNMMHNFTLLVARQLCEHLKYFRENYSDVVSKHITHQYYEEMCMKSHIVSLNI